MAVVVKLPEFAGFSDFLTPLMYLLHLSCQLIAWKY